MRFLRGKVGFEDIGCSLDCNYYHNSTYEVLCNRQSSALPYPYLVCHLSISLCVDEETFGSMYRAAIHHCCRNPFSIFPPSFSARLQDQPNLQIVPFF